VTDQKKTEGKEVSKPEYLDVSGSDEWDEEEEGGGEGRRRYYDDSDEEEEVSSGGASIGIGGNLVVVDVVVMVAAAAAAAASGGGGVQWMVDHSAMHQITNQPSNSCHIPFPSLPSP